MLATDSVTKKWLLVISTLYYVKIIIQLIYNLEEVI